jgi:import inner membrane translocase subunit TIM21
MCTRDTGVPRDAGTPGPTGSSEAASEAASSPPSAEKPAPVESAQQPAGDNKTLTLQDHEGENLPPLAFEPGIAGAAQKGVSAIVIAFGAAAFGACMYGISLALFPSASSTQSIYSEAFDLVQKDADVSFACGSPLRAHGIDHGGSRGRRNAMERFDILEDGEELAIVRFIVSGPQGAGIVQVQVPAKRRRGEFKYVVFENRRNRQISTVVDNRVAAAPAVPEPASSRPAE